MGEGVTPLEAKRERQLVIVVQVGKRALTQAERLCEVTLAVLTQHRELVQRVDHLDGLAAGKLLP